MKQPSCVLNERDFTRLPSSSIQSPTLLAGAQPPSAPSGKSNPCLKYDTTIPRDSQIRIWIMPVILAKNDGQIVKSALYIVSRLVTKLKCSIFLFNFATFG
ncbi:unnamed protein product [Lasius platythorax]|uniref:Uncharacterized protein n=1 Tax=Lasius platythorax TaxID=488582 RepID=A0AAV2NA14_9HYME